MKILLDTHVFLWWCDGNARLTERATQAISDGSNEVFVSAATLWEMATKIRIGKLLFPRPLGGSLVDEVEAEQFSVMPVSGAHAELAGTLDHDHRDPFDRMLIAQSLYEGITLVSNEAVFDEFGVRRIW